MSIWLLAILIAAVALPVFASDPVTHKNGIVDVPSKHSVDETVERLKSILQAKEITLFALVDHSGEAAKVVQAGPGLRADFDPRGWSRDQLFRRPASFVCG